MVVDYLTRSHPLKIEILDYNLRPVGYYPCTV
jgi:hypothetical protein